ncbi:hypothetical protein JCM6882_008483 [Rhodosporidiobolus microsporus]
MPLWSRSTPTPSTSTPPPAPPAPLFLANHHRSSSSNLPAALASTSPPANTALARPSKHGRRDRSSLSASEAASLGADDDPWDSISDDEASVADLAGRIHTVGLTVKPPSGAGTPTAEGPGGGAGGGGASAPSPSSSSWFNPFGSSSASRTPHPPSRQASTSSSLSHANTPGASPSLGAEAVAAALLGRSAPSSAVASSSSLAPPSGGAGKPGLVRNGASYLAGASKVQEEADRAVREEERRRSVERGEEPSEEEAGSPPTSGTRSSAEKGEGEREGEKAEETEEEKEERVRKESRYQEERWKKSIRPDVDELVKDPAHVLHRLRTAWAPPPPSSPKTRHHQTAHRASISSVTSPDPSASASAAGDTSFSSSHHGGEDGEDDDDDPTAGYAPLDPSAVSSTDPSLFDYSAPPPNPEEEGERGRENRRKRKFLEVLGADSVDLAELRKLAWNGVPGELRSMVWGLLLGYLPLPSSRRCSTLARKRSEYASLVRHAFSRGVSSLDPQIWHQISIDVPRTRPGVLLWAQEATQRSLERVLYVWAIRHPASGYVQGINDLVCPFFEVFLAGYIDSDPSLFSPSALAPHVLEALEADTFWCLSKLLDGIQDNYIFAQPGIQRLVGKMEGLCKRVDAPLATHLKSEGVEFIQFAFRWMNCLLMRELSVPNIVRMWDTYLAEGGDAFSEFHLYVCLAFLVRWSDKLREMDFQSIIIFLQSLPTQDWTDKDTELLLSEAFLWSRTFQAR